MNQTSLQTFSITSQHFIDHLDQILIQLAKTISIEQGIKPHPDAMLVAREILLNKAHSLLSDEQKETITKVKEQVIKNIENNNLDNFYKNVYEVLKIAGLL